jgi:hypothetical protein
MSSSMIQPRFGEDAFPIGRFILNRASSLGLSRAELVRRLGYRDAGGGHRALSELLMTGTVPPIAARSLAGALEVDQATVDAVIALTAAQSRDTARKHILAQEEAYRAAFRPHLQVQIERQVPSPIFVAAMIGVARLRIVPLPDEAISDSQDKRDRIVKAQIVEHYRSHGGQIPAFGAITGYVLVLVPGYDGADFGVPYDRGGMPAGPMRLVQRLAGASLGLKSGGNRLSLNGLLRSPPIHVNATADDK